MELKEACVKALRILKKEYNDEGFSAILDAGDRWIFSGCNKKHEVLYGKPEITVYKDTGKTEYFLVFDGDNLAILERAVKVEIPKEYIV